MPRLHPHSGSMRRSAHRAALRASGVLRAGERLLAYFSWDFALCECPPTTRLCGIACIAVGELDGIARCLGCGESWEIPERRRADRMGNGGQR